MTASSVSPPAFRISMARAQARSPLALEMMTVLEVWAEAIPSAGSKAEPNITALRLIPLSLFIFRSTCHPFESAIMAQVRQEDVLPFLWGRTPDRKSTRLNSSHLV